MAKKSKLLAALDAHKGRNFYLEKQKKLQKAAEKRKKGKDGQIDEDSDVEKVDEEEVAERTEVKVKSKQRNNDKNDKKVEAKSKKDQEEEDGQSSEESLEESSDENEDNGDDEKQAKPTKDSSKGNDDKDQKEEEDEEEEDEEEDDDGEDESDIPLSDLEDEDRADVIPHQRLTINNAAAIKTVLKRISFVAPFSEHNSLISKTPLDIPDVHDDLQRELAFYTVCQTGAKEARSLLLKEGVPFSRPTDYFAEMVKSDEHMSKIKKKLHEEAAAKKASADAKKQRDLKKFGKAVQVAKLQQRQKEKRELLEKVNSLKRKRNAGGTTGPEDQSDLFDVALDDANKPSDRKRPGPNIKRQKKNEKYGFGGKKKYKKSGDAESSADLSGFSVHKMKGKRGGSGGAAKRPGKGRRAAMRS
ncbi:rRNA-processing protein and EBNA1-binding protein ebp2 [Ascosphaera aggregata]|nr:rRNA-processing protein and EBNA1-binding protein ebp2 [Ascosphaera aggregata]